MSILNILMAQMNTLVGDFEGNTQKVIDVITWLNRCMKRLWLCVLN